VSAPLQHPQVDLIFIAPIPGGLDLIACQESGQRLLVQWHESRSIADDASVQTCLAEMLGQHALNPDTSAVLLAPPGTGGLFARPALDTACRTDAWIKHQLGLSVPYPLTEIQHSVHCRDGLARFFWLPTAWINSQKSMLAKLGLKLCEIYPRGLILEPGDSGLNAYLIEHTCNGEILYDLRNGLVQQAIKLPQGIDADTRKACIAAMYGDIGQPGGQPGNLIETVVSNPVWADCLDKLWRNPQLAVCIDHGLGSIWSPVLRIAVLLVLASAVIAGLLSWRISETEDALTNALREKKKHIEPSKRFIELERSLREKESVIAATKNISSAPTPLHLLAELTRILPATAWLQQLTFDGKLITVSGKGISDDALIKILQDEKFWVEKMRQEPVLETNDFRLRIGEKPSSSEGGKS
jgi:hypothetical protein